MILQKNSKIGYSGGRMPPNAIKKAKFTKGKVSGLSNAEAARQAGCPAKTAKQQGHRLANDPAVKEAISEALKDWDVKKSFEETNRIIDIALKCEIPQTATALKGTDMKNKLAGLYPKEKIEVEHLGQVEHVVNFGERFGGKAKTKRKN